MTATTESQTDRADRRVAGRTPAATAAKRRSRRIPHYLALRNFALSISVFNVFGYTLLGFEQPWLWPIFAVVIGYTTEIVFELISAWAQQAPPAAFLGTGARGMYEFLLPAHITALAVNMLLYANNQFWPVLFGVIVGVSAKYVLQAPINGRMRHFMNPSNLGITAVLLALQPLGRASRRPTSSPRTRTRTSASWCRSSSPRPGTVINAMLTKRMALIVGWMGAFAIQAFLRHWIWHVQLYSALGVMTGIAFVLFTNYMITDPGTTPSRPRTSSCSAASVAFVYGILMLFNIVYTLFFATAIVCALRGLGWWGIHLMRKRKARLAGDVPADEQAPAATEQREPSKPPALMRASQVRTQPSQ